MFFLFFKISVGVNKIICKKKNDKKKVKSTNGIEGMGGKQITPTLLGFASVPSAFFCKSVITLLQN